MTHPPEPTITAEEAEQDLIRAAAIALRGCREFALAYPTDSAAADLLFTVMDHRCPCGAPAELNHLTITCENGHRRSLKSATFRGSKLPLRLWLAAIWHLHVSDVSIAARGFARRYGVDKMSAWRLLRRVRHAFILFGPSTAGAQRQTMGRQSPVNEASCVATLDGGLLTMLDSQRAHPRRGRPHPAAALFLGQFQAWLTCVFRGVRRHHHDAYLAEFTDRQRRGYASA